MQALLRENYHEITSSFHVLRDNFHVITRNFHKTTWKWSCKNMIVTHWALFFAVVFFLGWQQWASVSTWFWAWFKHLRQTGNSSSHLHIVHLSPMPSPSMSCLKFCSTQHRNEAQKRCNVFTRDAWRLTRCYWFAHPGFVSVCPRDISSARCPTQQSKPEDEGRVMWKQNHAGGTLFTPVWMKASNVSDETHIFK